MTTRDQPLRPTSNPGAASSAGETDAAAHALRTRQAITLSLLFLAGVVNFFDRTALSVANTTVRAEMHLTATQMGWLLSAFSLAYGIAQLPLVELMQRSGTRSVLGAGLALWSAAQALTGLVRTFPQFLTLRVLLGAGESPFYPCGVQATREWFPERTRGRATAVMSMSQTIGLAAAPPVLTWLILRTGWRHMFIILGLAGLLASVAWVALYKPRATPPEPDPADPAPATTAAPHPHVILTLSEARRKDPSIAPREGRRHEPATHPASILPALLRRRTVWGMMLGFGGINYTVWLYLAWLPGYLQAARHLSLATTGWVTAIPFLAGAVGMFSSGVVTDARAKRGTSLTSAHRTNIVIGMILSAASTLIVANSHTTPQAVAGISAAIFFIHFGGTSGWGYVQAVALPAHVASLSALQNFASFLIASAAPVITGWLLDRTHSFTIALGLCSLITLLGALSYATLAAPDHPLQTSAA